MMFHTEDLEYITRARLLAIFLMTLNYSEDAANASGASQYAITFSNTKNF